MPTSCLSLQGILPAGGHETPSSPGRPADQGARAGSESGPETKHRGPGPHGTPGRLPQQSTEPEAAGRPRRARRPGAAPAPRCCTQAALSSPSRGAECRQDTGGWEGGGSSQDPAPGPVCPRPPRFDLGSHATFKTQTHGQSSFSPLVYFPHHSKNPDVTAKARQRTRSDFTPPWSWGLADHGGLATARVSGQN